MIVDWETYKDLTGDVFTEQAKAERNLARAQQRAEEMTGRKFDRAEYTEALTVDEAGRVWPSATPVASVSVPITATVGDDALSIATGTVTWADAVAGTLPAYPAQVARPRVLVTYVGGYDAVTPSPTGLVAAICELAHRYNFPADMTTVPAGATSVSATGQSVSGSRLGGSASVPPALRAEIMKHQHLGGRLP
jgi:hypothetical protein